LRRRPPGPVLADRVAMAHVNAPDGTIRDAAMVRAGSWLAVSCVAVAVAVFSGGALAQNGKTVRLVVPVPPGASTDAVARLMAEQIGRAQGVTFVVENRPGASGMIGTEQCRARRPTARRC